MKATIHTHSYRTAAIVAVAVGAVTTGLLLSNETSAQANEATTTITNESLARSEAAPMTEEEVAPLTDEEILDAAEAVFANLQQNDAPSFQKGAPSPTEYTVVTDADAGVKFVIPVGGELPTINSDGTVSLPPPPSDALNRADGTSALNSGASAAADGNIIWDPSGCNGVTYTSGAHAGNSMFWCEQWGNAQYANPQGLRYPVIRLNNVCAKVAGASYINLVGCGIIVNKMANMPEVNWSTYQPQVNSSGACRDITIGVQIFGVGISNIFQACEKITVTRGNAPDYQIWWDTSTGPFGIYNFIGKEQRVVATELSWSLPATQTQWWPNRLLSLKTYNGICQVSPSVC